MTPSPEGNRPGRVLFDEFEFFPDRLELRRNGAPLRMQQQPLRVLAALVRRPGDLVTREEIRRDVWGEGIHLDFHDSLNHSIKYLRDALGDDPAKPRFVETVPRRGYRFVAAVTTPGVEEIPTVRVRAPVAETGTSRPRPGWRRLGIAAGLVSLIAVAAVISIASIPPKVPRVLSVEQVTHLGFVGAVLTDGVSIYVERDQGGTYQILRSTAKRDDELTPIRTPFRNTMLLDISPDKKQLLISAFEHWGDEALLYRLQLTTGAAERVGSIVSYSAKWSPDGRQLAYRGANAGAEGVYVASANGDAARKVFNQAGNVDSWSPDGHTIYVSTMDAVNGGTTMWQVAADGSGAQEVLPTRDALAIWGEGVCCGAWTRDGRYLLFFESRLPTTTMWAAQRRALGRMDRSTVAEVYAAGFRVSSPPAVPPDRDRLFVVGWNEDRELMRLDARRGEFVALRLGSQAGTARWSPDAQWVVYSRPPENSLWKSRVDGSGQVQLVDESLQAYGAAWSPDGKQLAVHILKRGKPGKIAIVPAEGGATRILLADEHSVDDTPWWSPDGQSLYMGRTMLDAGGRSTKTAIWKVDVRSENGEKLAGTENLDSPVLSPDGRWIAAQSDDSRRLLLYEIATHKTRELASGVYISAPQWTRDSSALVYQDARVSEEQPIFRINIAGGTAVKMASSHSFAGPQVSQFRLVALDPEDMPVAVAIRRNADVYALNLEMP